MPCYLTFKISPIYGVSCPCAGHTPRWSEEPSQRPRPRRPCSVCHRSPSASSGSRGHGWSCPSVVWEGESLARHSTAHPSARRSCRAKQMHKSAGKGSARRFNQCHVIKVPSHSAFRHHLLVHNWYMGVSNIWHFVANMKKKWIFWRLSIMCHSSF